MVYIKVDMIKIAMLQIGLKRLYDTVKHNHEKFYNELRKKYELKIYDFYRESADPECPYKESGPTQLYDLKKAISYVEEEFVIKMRSDIYLTDTAIRTILKYIDDILQGQLNIAFFGIDFMNGGEEHAAIETEWFNPKSKLKHNKVVDHVIVFKKSSIPLKAQVNKMLNKMPKVRSGNVFFTSLISDRKKTKNISTQIYKVIQHYDNISNYILFSTWISNNKKYSKSAAWILNNKDTINQF